MSQQHCVMQHKGHFFSKREALQSTSKTQFVGGDHFNGTLRLACPENAMQNMYKLAQSKTGDQKHRSDLYHKVVSDVKNRLRWMDRRRPLVEVKCIHGQKRIMPVLTASCRKHGCLSEGECQHHLSDNVLVRHV